MSAKVRAAEDLAVKLKLEERMKMELRRWFNNLVKEIRLYWAVHRTLPDFKRDEQSMCTILRDHYLIVEKYFKKRTRDHLRKSYRLFDRKDRATDDLVALTLLQYWKNNSEKQAKLILNTTIEQAQQICRQVVTTSQQAGVPLTGAQEAAAIKANFSATIKDRVDAIATVETQSAAEKTKLVEAGVVAAAMQEAAKPVNSSGDSGTGNARAGPTAASIGALALALGADDSGNISDAPEGLTKTWVAILDHVTREWHAEADGQTVSANQKFSVGGEYLAYPGDTDGGSAKNIINCRCSAVYNANN